MTEVETDMETAHRLETEAQPDDDLIGYESDADKVLRSDEHDVSQIEPPSSTQVDILGVDDESAADESIHHANAFEEDEEKEGGQHEATRSQASGSSALDPHDGEYETSHELEYSIKDSVPKLINDASPVVGQVEATKTKRPEDEIGTDFAHEPEYEEIPDHEHEISWENESEVAEEILETTEVSDELPRSGEEATSTAAATLNATRNDDDDNLSSRTDEPDLEHPRLGSDGIYDVNDVGIPEEDESETDYYSFPDITVQYKGEEFPFFSSHSEGFFSSLSIMDADMKAVLDGFRLELSNELGPQDDLVFRIEDLDLEFTESSSKGVLASVTLRQMVEVFDILLKNQDPDCSRSLYTHLFTRANAVRRLDYLMESATEGKGLREVAYGRHERKTRSLEALRAIGESRTSKEHESDRSIAAGTGADVERGLEESGEHTAGQDGDVMQQEPYESGVQENEGNDRGLSLASPAAGDIFERQEPEDEEFAIASAHQFIDNNDENIPLKDEAHDLLGLHLDASEALTPLVQADTDGHGDQEFGDDEDIVLGVTDASTTTTTLKDDSDAVHTSVEGAKHEDLDDGNDFDGAVEKDDVGEIDWQDESGLLNEASDLASPSTSKRARDDDEHDEDDENNAKRRRP